MAPPGEPIAVIGTGCRFPGQSSNPSQLWNLLSKPRDVQRKIDRFRAEHFYNADGHRHGTSNVQHAYLLTEDPRAFDAQFFNISASEAEAIDPQQRVLLEAVYESVESAGLSIDSLRGSKTAVYVGVMCDDFTDIVYQDYENIPTYAATGSARSILSNRISYFFDWHGPSMTIDTACSSSLIAVHQGVQALRSGESNVAVAGGANLIFGPKMFVAESNLSMLSPTGRSQMWDSNANGYARGEGVAAVVMKTLRQAIADGDHIECVIRETGINQDGRTMGITMPSSDAQCTLIHDTYARAGLDLANPRDRPQYFEAHGTGTKAGDPQEARAIYNAFFGGEISRNIKDTLHVGSIKTIVGHTEGTAGLAGLIKASLAIQNKTIPANLLFKNLNPDIEPFYGPIKIPTQALQWPELATGVPRRASVNSFGFGGANAHAIIESYEGPAQVARAPAENTVVPFLFSASTEKSLERQLQNYLEFFKTNDKIDIRDAALTMSRRSALVTRCAIPATSSAQLQEKIQAKLDEKSDGNNIGNRASVKDSRLLGVFTGQGAQWASMGSKLFAQFPSVRKTFRELQHSLDTLPESDRPDWNLIKELSAEGKASRIGEGRFSQPLCTAVQVALVDLLTAAGIRFSSVVGHSSGEIAACYAAGFIGRADAIRIAYYRGLYAKYASGPNGMKGAMMAVGTSMEDADELCCLPTFEGRISVAASNSSASVTISGDADAIDEAAFIFEDESKFARKLKVDTAYHSHHMKPCAEHYINALNNCKIEIKQPDEDAAAWHSSVLNGERMTFDHKSTLTSKYWMDNMLQAVLFSQALEAATKANEDLNIAMEVGPHPALKGPASLTIEESLKHAIPYTGSLKRGSDDVEAIAGALGFLWENVLPQVVDFKTYDYQSTGLSTTEVLKTLPCYAWDNDKVYWGESRSSKAFRLRSDAHHELLGSRLGEDTDGDISWRNHLKPHDSTWLRGHEIQGQKLFPAAGYAAIAIEASKAISPKRTAQLIELEELRIHQALAFIDEVAGVEIVTKLSNIKRSGKAEVEQIASARYECFACLNKEAGNFVLMTSATVKVVYGEPTENTLPPRIFTKQKMSDVDVEEFYSSLVNVGYNYQGIFKGISSLKRTKDLSAGTIFSKSDDVLDQPYTFHPAPLDVAFQSVFAAIGSPGDGMLWTIHVPTVIRRISVNTSAVPARGGLETELEFDAFLSQNGVGGVSGDVLIYGEDKETTVVQIEGLHVTPLSAATAANDKTMFQHDVWDVGTPNLEAIVNADNVTHSNSDTAADIERSCLFYLKQLLATITEDDRDRCDWHQAHVLEWAEHVIELVSTDHHPILRKAWLDDSEPVSFEKGDGTELDAEMNLIHDIGKKLIPFIRGDISAEELYADFDIVEHFHKSSYGIQEYVGYLGQAIKQIAHRHQNLTILQIGDRLETTKGLLEKLEKNFSYYTFTNVSSDFFEEASEALQTPDQRFTFKTMDIEIEPSSQGFKEHSLDLVIAINTLHTANNLDDALVNVRKLLRPGGYLVLLEATNTGLLRTNLIMSGMPDYWTIEDERRSLSPLADHKSWDEALRDAGFSGIDTATTDSGFSQMPFSVMISQAMDPQISLMRQPLLAEPEQIPIDELLIVGGGKLSTARLVKQVMKNLKQNVKNVTVVESLQRLTAEKIPENATTLCLAELDQAFFNPFTEQKLQILQRLVEKSRQMLWVVQGAAGENPYSNMIIGVARCLVGEAPHLRWQTLDFDLSDRLDAEIICEELLRLRVHANWRNIHGFKPLWPMESEIRVTNGELYVPRCSDYPGPNARYNSSKRIIRKNVSLSECAVGIVKHGQSGFEVQEQLSTTQFSGDSSDLSLITVNVEASSFYSFKVADAGYFHLVVGTIAGSNTRVLAFTQQQLSTVTIPSSWSTTLSRNLSDVAQTLSTLADGMIAYQTIQHLKPGQTILVHEPEQKLVEQLKGLAAKKRVSLILTSCDESRTDCRYLHPSTSGRTLHKNLPNSAASFVDLSKTTRNSELVTRIVEMLPRTCVRSTLSNLIVPHGYAVPGHHNERISSVLQHLASAASNDEQKERTTSDFLTLANVPSVSKSPSTRTVVEWRATSTVPVRVVPAEETFNMRSDRTYFMVGLTGSLGLSLCRFMIEHGAKHFALTSRNPQVDELWMAQMAEKGADVRVYAMDVTNKQSVENTVAQIRKEMPPIVGVANGAMILIDCLFANHDIKKFSTTLKAKVDGTKYLDEIFTEKDLDFFMAFSSLAFTSGNFGQSSYAAANAFMTSVVQGRRSRGLAGCVMHLSGIYGIGYVERTDRKIMSHLEKYGMFNISEWDFHQFFAEAVAAGRPESGLSPDVASNLTTSDPEKDEHVPAWVDCPRYGHFRFVRQEAEDEDGETTSAANVRPLLAEATNEEAIYNILLEGLKATLVKQLHLPSADQISPDQVVVELGVDSLTAVDLRAWFTKELDIDMPVLKILGGATLAEVVSDAVKRLPAALTPKVKTEGQASTSSEKPAESATEGPAVEGEKSEAEAEVESTPEVEDSANKELPPLLSRNDSSDTSGSAADTEGSVSAGDDSSATSVSLIDGEDGMKAAEAVLEQPEEELPENNDELELPPFGRPQKFEKIVKMSYAATRFWFLDQFLSDPSTFNLMMVVRFSGSIDVEKVAETIASIGQRHEAFRTAFFADINNMNQPAQGILPTSKFHLVADDTKTNEEFKEMIPTMQKEPFDLETGLVARANLFSFKDGSHALALRFHHIVFDGFSFNILLSDLNKTYFGEKLPRIEMQYSDYAAHERDLLETGKMEKSIHYWKEQYTDFPDPLPLFPAAHVSVRQPLHHYDYEEVKHTLDARSMLRIRDQAKRMKATTFHYFLATFKTFLFRFLDTKDIAIGMADAHRNEPGIVNTIGFFLNLLPLRFKYDEAQSFGDAVTEARTTAQGALANADVPFDILLERLNAPRSASYNPLFQAFIDYRQYSGEATTVLSKKSVAETFVGRTAYDLVLDINDIANGDLNISMRGQKYLYSTKTMQLLMDSFVRLLKSFSTARRVLPSQVPIYETRDVKNALALGRGPYAEPEWPATISHRIDEMAEKYASEIALKDPETSLTYGQMMQRVNSITEALEQAGIGSGYHVGVLQKPTVDWMCSLVGIWKAGAIYIPLDLRNGVPRLQTIVDNANLDAVIYHNDTTSEKDQLEFKEISLINVSSIEPSTKSSTTETKAEATGKAAIIYTSGSTGTPKGIVLTHAGIRNEMEGYSKAWSIGRQVVLQQSAYSFDFSLDQMLSALSNGGSLFVASSAMREDPSAIADVVRSEGITYTKATPSEYSAWIEHGLDTLAQATSWRMAFGGGEAITRALMKDFKLLDLSNLRLLNSYGPAEATISCVKADIDYRTLAEGDEEVAPAGFPLPNYSLQIVDKNLQPLPIGTAGEIVIGGAGISQGYLGDDEQTSAKFIEDSQVTVRFKKQGWTRVYRSGDKGYIRSDGNLIILGRMEGDTQIKLRGIRIELADIENTIIKSASSSVVQAVVSTRGEPKFLVAHVKFAVEVPAEEQKKKAAEILAGLPLPSFMKPSIMIPVENFPLNSHRKTDRRAIAELPLPKIEDKDDELSETELALRNIWRSIVSKDLSDSVGIGKETDFFQAGGNSLLLVKLQAVILQKLDVSLPIVKLFTHSSLEAMAEIIEQTDTVNAIDWTAETAVNADSLLHAQSIASLKIEKPAGKVVLLTGASGYLGRRLLRNLAARPDVAKIHAVAVRSPDSLQKETTKLQIHKGDLTEPQLGLDDDIFNMLAAEVDVIIHSGANRAFWDQFHLLRNVNLSSTKQLAALANPRKIPIHFLSSGGVLDFVEDKSMRQSIKSIKGFTPPVNGMQGYVSSKWASEVYLENLQSQFEIPVQIHRVTPATTETVATVPTDLLEELGNIAVELQSLPVNTTSWEGTFDLLEVEPLADTIISSAIASVGGSDSLNIVQYPGSIRLDLKELMGEMDGYKDVTEDFERVLPHVWIGKAKKMGFNYHVASNDLMLGGALSLRR